MFYQTFKGTITELLWFTDFSVVPLAPISAAPARNEAYLALGFLSPFLRLPFFMYRLLKYSCEKVAFLE